MQQKVIVVTGTYEEFLNEPKFRSDKKHIYIWLRRINQLKIHKYYAIVFHGTYETRKDLALIRYMWVQAISKGEAREQRIG